MTTMETVPPAEAHESHRVRRRRHRRGLRYRLKKVVQSPNFVKFAVVLVGNAVFIAAIIGLANLIK